MSNPEGDASVGFDAQETWLGDSLLHSNVPSGDSREEPRSRTRHSPANEGVPLSALWQLAASSREGCRRGTTGPSLSSWGGASLGGGGVCGGEGLAEPAASPHHPTWARPPASPDRSLGFPGGASQTLSQTPVWGVRGEAGDTCWLSISTQRDFWVKCFGSEMEFYGLNEASQVPPLQKVLTFINPCHLRRKRFYGRWDDTFRGSPPWRKCLLMKNEIRRQSLWHMAGGLIPEFCLCWSPDPYLTPKRVLLATQTCSPGNWLWGGLHRCFHGPVAGFLQRGSLCIVWAGHLALTDLLETVFKEFRAEM